MDFRPDPWFIEQLKKSVPQEFFFIFDKQTIFSTSCIARNALFAWSPEGTTNSQNSAQ